MLAVIAVTSVLIVIVFLIVAASKRNSNKFSDNQAGPQDLPKLQRKPEKRRI